MKEDNKTIFYKKSVIPKHVKINTEDYFIGKKAQDIINLKCNKISLKLLNEMTQKNNFEFETFLDCNLIEENSFLIENLLGIKDTFKKLGSKIKVKIIIYPNQSENDKIYTIANKLMFPENKESFFYNALNYDETGEIFYISSLNSEGDPEFKNTILPTNIYFYQSVMDDFHWRYLEPDDEQISQFLMENKINPFSLDEKEKDLILFNFNFK